MSKIYSISSLKKLMLPIYLVLLVNCTNKELDESSLNVVNGVETDDYPAVIKLKIKKGIRTENCTGTFIKHNLVLTAAHCVYHADEVFLPSLGLWSQKFIVHSKYSGVYDSNYAQYDLAVVKFRDNSSKNTINISEIGISAKDKLTLVGFGHNNYDTTSQNKISENSEVGIKRKGENYYVPNSFLNIGIVTFMGTSQNKNDGRNVSIAQGDSGGPLIVEGKGIVGVASQQRTSTDPKIQLAESGNEASEKKYLYNQSYYTYLLSDESKKFFTYVQDQEKILAPLPECESDGLDNGDLIGSYVCSDELLYQSERNAVNKCIQDTCVKQMKNYVSENCKSKMSGVTFNKSIELCKY